MQNQASSCSPETLRRMQSIFDDVWRELERQHSPHTFPWFIEAARYVIAQMVLENIENLRDPQRIKREVLKKMTDGSK